MPIKGLTENTRLIRLGKIHLGVKKTSAKGIQYPSATNYFVVPPEVAEVFGEKPTELPVLIPVEDEELFASQYYKSYSNTRGLTCKGDGETCRRMIDKVTGAKANRDTKEIVWVEGAICEGRDCPDYKAKDCREVMNLQFLLPDVPGVGVWQIDTSSINSIRNINSAIAMIRALPQKRISWVPVWLTLEPMEVTNPDDGKKKIVRVLNFRVRSTLKELLASTAKPIQDLLLPLPAEDAPPLDNAGEIAEGEIAHEEVTEELIDELFSETPVQSSKPASPPTKAELEAAKEKVEQARAAPKYKRDPKSVTQANILFSCWEDFDVKPAVVFAELGGIKSVLEIKDPVKAYIQIAAVRMKSEEQT